MFRRSIWHKPHGERASLQMGVIGATVNAVVNAVINAEVNAVINIVLYAVQHCDKRG